MGGMLPSETVVSPTTGCNMAEPTEAKLPFGMGSIDFTNPMSAVVMFVALTLGFVVYHMTDGIGNQLAQRINSFIASATGTNVGGASDSSPEVV
jgi:hypothetical protein